MITKFKDLIKNIEAIKATYKGSEDELQNEDICFTEIFSSLPNVVVGIWNCPSVLAVAKDVRSKLSNE